MLQTRRVGLVVFVALLIGTPLSALAQAPTDTYFEFLLARRLEADGDVKGARAALDRAAAADPKSAEIRAEIASLHLRRNERGEAEKAAKAALALDEKNVEANRVLGLLFAAAAETGAGERPNPQAAANVRQAITYLERAAAGTTVTADATLYYTLGRLYIRDGTPDKAVTSLARVLSQNPNSVQGRLALAQAYAANKDVKAAINTLEEIIEDEPRVASALGQYQEEAGLLMDAAASYTLALAVQPANRELKIRRIAVLLEAKQYDRAAGFAGEARKQHPTEPVFARLQGRALFDAGDRSGGISVLESAVQTFPKDTASMFALADIYADAGRAMDAERLLRQLLAAEPANANALNYLGYLLANRGDQLDEAIRLVRRALDVEPENGAYLDSLGWAYFRKGDHDEAEKYLVAAAARLPQNSEVQDHLGDLHVRKGRLPEAIEAWTRALNGDGQDVEKAAIEKKISTAKGKMQNSK